MQTKSNWLSIHDNAMTCARDLKQSYSEMMTALIEVDLHQVYFRVDIADLFTYSVEMLQLPESTARDFVSVIRTSKSVPELSQAVIDGRTTVSKARRICSVITPKNHKEWIDLACECPLKIIKKCVAMANPRAAVEESLEYVSGDILELKLAVSEEWAELLKDTKDLMSQKECRAVSTEEALFKLMAEFKRKNDPVAKAVRASSRQSKAPAVAGRNSIRLPKQSSVQSDEPEIGVETQNADTHRYRPMPIEHAVALRDQNQCVHIDKNGRRCPNKRWLHKHHIAVFANGGRHTLENLETLCSGHHRIRHLRAETESAGKDSLSGA